MMLRRAIGEETAGEMVGLLAICLTNLACLGFGVYKGLMESGGEQIGEFPFKYLFSINVAGNSIGNALHGGDGLLKVKDPTPSKTPFDRALVATTGAFYGAVRAPIVYALGYGAGYLTRRAFQ